MNILPKKSWHVRNKDNIAKVRRDEAKAEEERRAKEDRQKLAEREARTQLLRERARERTGLKDFIPLSLTTSQAAPGGHVNFFEELENGNEECKRTNKEHEREKKEEAEKYEKQIGYLTYLGQDTNEALGKKNWYDEAPERDQFDKGEVDMKKKLKDDPLEIIKKYIPSKLKSTKFLKEEKEVSADNLDISRLKHKIKDKCHKKKRTFDESNSHKVKKEKHHSHKSKKKLRKTIDTDSSDDSDYSKKRKIELLRIERIKREREERLRTQMLLDEMNDQSSSKAKPSQRKYNSQFNPDIARQNQSK